MPLLEIPDEILKLAGLRSASDGRFACRLFDAGKLPLWPAAKLAALSRVEMQAVLDSEELRSIAQHCKTLRRTWQPSRNCGRSNLYGCQRYRCAWRAR